MNQIIEGINSLLYKRERDESGDPNHECLESRVVFSHARFAEFKSGVRVREEATERRPKIQ